MPNRFPAIADIVGNLSRKIAYPVNNLSTITVFWARKLPDVEEEKVTVGQKVKQIREEMGMSQEAIAAVLGVSRGTVSSYEARTNANPSPDKVQRLVDHVNQVRGIPVSALKLWFFDGKKSAIPGAEAPISQTVRDISVYYNGTQQSNSAQRPLIADTLAPYLEPRIIQVEVLVGGGSRIWSAKDAQRVTVKVFEWFFEFGRHLVKIDRDSLGVERRGSILAFRPDDYAHPDRYLYCSERANPENRTIRYLDGLKLVSPDAGEEPVQLADWDVIGYAEIDIRPTGVGLPEVHFYPNGVPVKRR